MTKPIYLSLAFLVASISIKAQNSFATIDHVAIYVQNLDSSSTFYSKLFHFETIPNPFQASRTIWFKIGDQIQFHLIEGAKGPAPFTLFHHLCFSVRSIEE